MVPLPVLSLAADALIDLDGTDAITGLWMRTSILPSLPPHTAFLPNSPSYSVFAKCKESLQDGPRLEYISWRLWYRELEARRSNKPFPILPHSPLSIPASCPLTPVSEQGVEHPGKFIFPLQSVPFPRLLPFLTSHTCFLLYHLQGPAPHPQNLVKLDLDLAWSALRNFHLNFLRPLRRPPVALSPPD